jgi:hypothetical protein
LVGHHSSDTGEFPDSSVRDPSDRCVAPLTSQSLTTLSTAAEASCVALVGWNLTFVTALACDTTSSSRMADEDDDDDDAGETPAALAPAAAAAPAAGGAASTAKIRAARSDPPTAR